MKCAQCQYRSGARHNAGPVLGQRLRRCTSTGPALCPTLSFDRALEGSLSLGRWFCRDLFLQMFGWSVDDGDSSCPLPALTGDGLTGGGGGGDATGHHLDRRIHQLVVHGEKAGEKRHVLVLKNYCTFTHTILFIVRPNCPASVHISRWAVCLQVCPRKNMAF